MESLLTTLPKGEADPYVVRKLVEWLLKKKRAEEAIVILRNSLINDPLNFDLLRAQSTLYQRIGRGADAEQPLLTALKIQPENLAIYYQLSQISMDQENVIGFFEWRKSNVAPATEPISKDEQAEQSAPNPSPPTEVTAESTQALGDRKPTEPSGGDRGPSVHRKDESPASKGASPTPEVEPISTVIGRIMKGSSLSQISSVEELIESDPALEDWIRTIDKIGDWIF